MERVHLNYKNFKCRSFFLFFLKKNCLKFCFKWGENYHIQNPFMQLPSGQILLTALCYSINFIFYARSFRSLLSWTKLMIFIKFKLLNFAFSHSYFYRPHFSVANFYLLSYFSIIHKINYPFILLNFICYRNKLNYKSSSKWFYNKLHHLLGLNIFHLFFNIFIIQQRNFAPNHLLYKFKSFFLTILFEHCLNKLLNEKVFTIIFRINILQYLFSLSSNLKTLYISNQYIFTKLIFILFLFLFSDMLILYSVMLFANFRRLFVDFVDFTNFKLLKGYIFVAKHKFAILIFVIVCLLNHIPINTKV
jgi:hypothetical protein